MSEDPSEAGPQVATQQQAAFNEGELVVVSLEAAPGQRPQPAVARALVARCTAAGATLTLQSPLRPTLADAPVRPPQHPTCF